MGSSVLWNQAPTITGVLYLCFKATRGWEATQRWGILMWITYNYEKKPQNIYLCMHVAHWRLVKKLLHNTPFMYKCFESKIPELFTKHCCHCFQATNHILDGLWLTSCCPKFDQREKIKRGRNVSEWCERRTAGPWKLLLLCFNQLVVLCSYPSVKLVIMVLLHCWVYCKAKSRLVVKEKEKVFADRRDDSSNIWWAAHLISNRIRHNVGVITEAMRQRIGSESGMKSGGGIGGGGDQTCLSCNQ